MSIAVPATPPNQSMPRPQEGRRSVSFVVDYPVAGGELYANVRTITGWAWGDGRALDEIRLRIDDGPLITGRLGYPRLDAVDRGVSTEDALGAGFRFEFDPEVLGPGEHHFEFSGAVDGSLFTHRVTARRAAGPRSVRVADVFIDIVGYCNLRCTMCPHGDFEGMKLDRPSTAMSPALLDQVLANLAASACLTGTVNLYNWGDPVLHPRLDEMLATCEAHGQRVFLSSNLAMDMRFLERLFQGRTDLLMVSISGMTQETYARNHRGGEIARVLENVRAAAGRRDAVKSILLKYLVFDYNRHEIEQARAFAHELGIDFGAYRGAIPSLESRFVQLRNQRYADATSAFVGEELRIDKIAGRACPQESNIIVDPEGNLDVCAMSWGHAFGASATTADLREYLTRKLDNPTCTACQQAGYSHYRHYEVIDADLLRPSRGERAPQR